ncbi:MAG: hypothetical protein ABSG07_19860 [Terriglobales bacterium]|jgi:hypothetical protein
MIFFGSRKSYAYNVAPVNDHAPFFFFTLKTLLILSQKGPRHEIDWKVNLGVLVLIENSCRTDEGHSHDDRRFLCLRAPPSFPWQSLLAV